MQYILGQYNFWVVIMLMMIGFYIVITNGNLIKKLIGLNIFQVSVFIMYISMGFLDHGTAPIYSEQYSAYASPLPHVLILTAIVVGISTTALGLAMAIRIHKAYGTLEEEQIQKMDPDS